MPEIPHHGGVIRRCRLRTPRFVMFPVNRVVDLILPWRNARLAEQIAQDLRETLVARTGDEAFGMSLPQLCGYVRARAGSLVAAKMEQALRKCDLAAGSRLRLLSRATERLVALVADDLVDRQRPARRLAAAA